MANRVFICNWSKSEAGYRLWVRDKPAVCGEGASFDKAQAALIDAIVAATPDPDSVIPVMPEYDPPIPGPASLAELLEPELYLIGGDESFGLRRAHPRSGIQGLNRDLPSEMREQFLASLFENGICHDCDAGRGPRTEQALVIDDVPSDVDAGWAWIEGITNHLRLFSDRFLSLFSKEELAPFRFRSVRLPRNSRRRQFFELQADTPIPGVGIVGFDADGIECSACGYRDFRYDEPSLKKGGAHIARFICKTDLPNPLPPCFPVSFDSAASMCVTRECWDRCRGNKLARGVGSERIGVVPPSQCDRQPRVRNRFEHCELCKQWPRPTDRFDEKRVVFPRVAKTWSFRNSRWIVPAAQEGLIQIVRHTSPIDEILNFLAAGAKPSKTEILSFRCPTCWRLGRIIIDTKNVSFLWR